jgi:hypothetical protein
VQSEFERTVDATFEFPGDEWEMVVDRFPIEAVSSDLISKPLKAKDGFRKRN